MDKIENRLFTSVDHTLWDILLLYDKHEIINGIIAHFSAEEKHNFLIAFIERSRESNMDDKSPLPGNKASINCTYEACPYCNSFTLYEDKDGTIACRNCTRSPSESKPIRERTTTGRTDLDEDDIHTLPFHHDSLSVGPPDARSRPTRTHDVKPNWCNICPNTYATPQELEDHINLKH